MVQKVLLRLFWMRQQQEREFVHLRINDVAVLEVELGF